MYMRTKCNGYFHDIIARKASGVWIFRRTPLGRSRTPVGRKLVGPLSTLSYVIWFPLRRAPIVRSFKPRKMVLGSLVARN